MHNLVLPGVVLTLAGLAGLGWCILQGLRIRRAGLPPAEVHARLHKLIAINLGSVAVAALGLAAVCAGLLL
jgi:hypothetical protein